MAEKTLVGHIGIDSGQLLIADPCYIRKDFATDEGDTTIDTINRGLEHFAIYGTLPEDLRARFDYDAVCAHTNTLGTSLLGDRTAIAVSTGGDGLVPVYLVTRKNGRRKIVIELD